MKPNFALNLSHEGISLLHRAKAGWLHVGDVALDAADLTDQLKVLRRTAADLESGALTTKLVIPNSQVLYTEIEASGPDTAARISQIRDGLVGLTPYDVSDLVFDWHMIGTKAHVAVVARETLHEAEAFAAEFRFNPVSYIAVPTNGEFVGEPYFGPTKHAAALLDDGDTIERDDEAMTILAPDRPKAPPQEPVVEPDTKIDSSAEPKAVTEVSTNEAVDEKGISTPKPKSKSKRTKSSKSKSQEKEEPELPETVEPVTFSSRRAVPPARRYPGLKRTAFRPVADRS